MSGLFVVFVSGESRLCYRNACSEPGVIWNGAQGCPRVDCIHHSRDRKTDKEE